MTNLYSAGSNLTCQVNSTALDTPLSRSVYVDMDIVPERLEMMPPIRTSTSARSPNARGIAELREGDKITVTCIASGAKPEVVLSSYAKENIFHQTHKLKATFIFSLTGQDLLELRAPSQYERHKRNLCKGDQRMDVQYNKQLNI